jgi:dTDP-4-dehydrorhamnose reductase
MMNFSRHCLSLFPVLTSPTMQEPHRILVLGASGQIGFELSRLSAKSGSQTLALSRSKATDWHNNCEWTACDFGSFDQLANIIYDFKPNTIINALAYTATEKAEDEADLAFHLNEELPKFLVNFDKPFNLIHYSSDYVYNDTSDNTLTESTPTDPQSVYAKSKLAGDQAILSNTQRASWIYRTSWVYSFRGKNFLKTMLWLFANKEELKVVDDQIGTPNSAYFLASTTLKAMELKIPTGLYHLSQNGYTSWWGFARAIYELSSNPSFVCKSILPCSSSEYPSRIHRPQNSRLDCTKLAAALDLRSLQDWQEGLKHELSRVN